MIVVACIPGITAEESQVGFKRELRKALCFSGMAKQSLSVSVGEKRRTREAIISKEKSFKEKAV